MVTVLTGADEDPDLAVRVFVAGASGRIRTCGTWYRKPVLYPLSYGGIARPGSPPGGAR
jgi:hypothetical protein